MLVSELICFDSFYIFFHGAPRVFTMLADRQRVPIGLTQFCVEIYYKYWLSINRKYRLLNHESSMAKWLELLPLKLGVVSSSPGLYIFLIKVFFFISLSFLCICLKFEVKQCANIYRKYDNTEFVIEAK